MKIKFNIILVQLKLPNKQADTMLMKSVAFDTLCSINLLQYTNIFNVLLQFQGLKGRDV